MALVCRIPHAVMLLRFTHRDCCNPGRMNASRQRCQHKPSRLVMNTPSETPGYWWIFGSRAGRKRLGKPMKMCGARA